MPILQMFSPILLDYYRCIIRIRTVLLELVINILGTKKAPEFISGGFFLNWIY
jgi:hypothetical protein